MFDLGIRSVRAMTFLLVEKIMKWRQTEPITGILQFIPIFLLDLEPARSWGDLTVLEALSLSPVSPSCLAL